MAADNFAPASMRILSNIVCYNKPDRLKNHTSNPPLTFFLTKTEVYFQALGFRYFEFLITRKQIPNRIRIRIFTVFVLALMLKQFNKGTVLFVIYYACKLLFLGGNFRGRVIFGVIPT